MNKLAKLLCAGLAAVLMAGSLASCGGPEDSATVLKIGGIGPLTGQTASYGTAVENGAQLAIDEINAAGGVNGIQLELDFQDDENNAQKAITAYGLLKDEGCKILMGTVTSAPCLAVKDLTYEDNMFQLTPSGSAVECTKYENTFRICFSDDNQGAASAQYISDRQLASKIAVIYDSSDPYSSGIYRTFKEKADELGLEIVSEQAFTSSNNTDFSVAVQQIKSSGAELVFLPIYYQQAALILQQANSAGLETQYFGCDGLDSIVQQLGNDSQLAEGVMLLTPFAADASDEKSQTFTAAYKAKYNNEIPNQFAADAYDAIYTIKAAMEQAGIDNASISVSDLCEKLKAAMTQITVDGVTGTMTWDENGEPTKDPKGMYIKDGSYTAMD